MDNTEELRTLAFCAGYAGIERGLELAGVETRTVAFVEIEAFAVANLVEKMEAGYLAPCPIWSNLKTFPLEKFRGCVDILTGGFPCQPFSAAGARGGDEDPRHLFPYFKKALGTIKPRFVFLENVDGIASAKLKGDGWEDPAGTPVLLHVLRELERLGYRATAGSYSAEEVGAPHLRKRWFIFGELSDTEGECDRQYKPQWERRASFSGASQGSKLAESNTKRLQGQPVGGISLEFGSKSHDQQSLRCSRTGGADWSWPARPGPFQFEHEPPRVVADGKNIRPRRGEDENGGDERGLQESQADEQSIFRRETQGCGGDGKAEESEVKPRLGRAFNGRSNRVDRLRLLGNAVVPQTAAKAWIELKERLDFEKN